MKPTNPCSRRGAQGLSLVELMIAIVLGLLVVGAAIGIFISNKQAYRATDNLGVLQENTRTAFELLARDAREAAGNPCVNNLPLANVINTPTTRWWTNFSNWGQTVRGFSGNDPFPENGAGFGTGSAQRLAGTDAIELVSGDNDVVTISGHNTAGNQFTVNTAAHGVVAGDLVLACNSRQAALFQASAVTGATISHGAGGTPGNCSGNLGLLGEGEPCAGRPVFEFAAPNSVLVKLHASRWFIANNPAGIPSLYQTLATGNTAVTQEVAQGVSDMTIDYLLSGTTDYVDSGSVGGNWANVVSARFNLNMVSPENVGTDGAPISRVVTYVISLRNRNL
ncbi:prepilin-type N-terminal cleavage/methylation domain-containing protein [Pseudoxanthomonas dokdonensis]|uniref:Type IV pilus assembly protein PilW n=1 Tax=Pseudoxanthomonas dokdonensis TaxID=344882 RepID=A0A0R0CHV5_9GAMM|nr:prepilin-type N-terminal cleavage/methylation domain-containing protein [Pseudoxanthomonas dokdonensis]KRG69157.1 hypothetical protein ABB29_12220 [Pseudoxanthomonas dokdonensis]